MNSGDPIFVRKVNGFDVVLPTSLKQPILSLTSVFKYIAYTPHYLVVIHADNVVAGTLYSLALDFTAATVLQPLPVLELTRSMLVAASPGSLAAWRPGFTFLFLSKQ